MQIQCAVLFSSYPLYSYTRPKDNQLLPSAAHNSCLSTNYINGGTRNSCRALSPCTLALIEIFTAEFKSSLGLGVSFPWVEKWAAIFWFPATARLPLAPQRRRQDASRSRERVICHRFNVREGEGPKCRWCRDMTGEVHQCILRFYRRYQESHSKQGMTAIYIGSRPTVDGVDVKFISSLS
ncbi:hypothetical protein ARMGADRAFT_4585 [Armillaria gallica]|uniref:Uncharacterized protein n=1 Tax=Armillaria gallica TaxID=47427 RepID=A0A2H3EKB5_ARMGA|nr:hypothetical protein ARMGADRAFT_4585 [Armillaria gallica]